VDPSQPVSVPIPLAELLSGSVAQPRFFSTMLGGFAMLALLLAAIGLHGLLTQVVQGRTREIGVRLALGATPAEILGMVLRNAGRLIVAGLAFGIGGAFLLTRALSGMLFGVSAVDPLVYVGTAAALTGVALIAAGFPARRAARLDPARILARSDP
jgi:ABC-type antimicrobial peptide transport system permease subunit